MAFYPPLNIVAKELERINTIQSEPIQILEDEGQVIIDWKSQGPFRYTTLSVEDDKDEYWLSNFERLHEEYSDTQSKLQNVVALEEEIQRLKFQVASLQKEIFGTSSEKQSIQPEVHNKAQELEAESPHAPTKNTQSKIRSLESYTGRKKLSDNLPIERIVYDIPVLEKICKCCNGKIHRVGEESVEKLTVVREHYKKRVIVTTKYSCKTCDTFYVSKAPKTMVPRSSYDTPEFLANIAVKRFQFAMPYDRQEKYLSSIGCPVSRTTLANLMIKSADKLEGVCEMLREELLSKPVIHADETVMKVLNESGRDPQKNSYLWLFMSGMDAVRPVVLFQYNQTRAGQFAADTLTLNGKQYTGYLAVDGYAGYNKVLGVRRVGCMAHVRRKFNEVLKISSGSNAGTNAGIAVKMIAELYAIEKKIKGEPPDKKYQVRQRESTPILHKIKSWLDNLAPTVLPKFPLGKAVNYFLSEWENVSRYVEDGRLSVDNNAAEREIKQFVIGRKNWLFASSVDGARANAVMYTLVATAKANGLDPYDYLIELYSKVPNIKSANDLEALLPWNIKETQTELKAA